jgi:hypothetical protein
MKQMLEALDKGTCFCILHYDEVVPPYDQYNYEDGHMEKSGIQSCIKTQIGFHWLNIFSIRPWLTNNPIIAFTIERNEFKDYHRGWGASKNYFRPYAKDRFALGFALCVRRGKILYLPCQRYFHQPESMEKCLISLIKSTITYLTRSSMEIPSWVLTPLFSKEKELHANLSDLESKIEDLKSKLQPYQIAKELAFLSEYEFEDRVPKFLTSHFQIRTYRDETFNEDFWILNSEGEKIAIGETKSHVGGIKKSDIYSLYNHRESSGQDDAFPALLVVNTHLNAKSWEDKIRPIEPQNYECAFTENIILLRIEDLLFFWNSIEEIRHNSEELLSNILNQKGWMEVKIDGSVVMHQKP